MPDSGPDPEPTYDSDVELAVRTFQQQRGLTVDGVVGPLTFRRLDEARWRLGDRILTHLPGNLMAGDDVYTLQGRLLDLGFKIGRVDGYFGPDTEAGVREFQRNFGIPPDGTCGPATLKALTRLSPMVKGGAPNALRAQERIREAGPHLGGKIVVIDVGRGHNLPDEHAETSDSILHDLAQRVEGRLVATGVQAFLTTPRWAAPRRGGRPGRRSRTAPAPTCSSRWRWTPRPARTRAASRRTSSATPTRTPGPRSASGSPAWSSARSSLAATSSTCAGTPRRGSSCGTPGCRPSASTPAT